MYVIVILDKDKGFTHLWTVWHPNRGLWIGGNRVANVADNWPRGRNTSARSAISIPIATRFTVFHENGYSHSPRRTLSNKANHKMSVYWFLFLYQNITDNPRHWDLCCEAFLPELLELVDQRMAGRSQTSSKYTSKPIIRLKQLAKSCMCQTAGLISTASS